MKLSTTPRKFLKQSGLKLQVVAKEMNLSPELLRYYLKQNPMDDDLLGSLRLAVQRITGRICEGLQSLQP